MRRKMKQGRGVGSAGKFFKFKLSGQGRLHWGGDI